MADYKDCYVAFFDILGFKNLITNSTCDQILSVFKAAKKKTTFIAHIGEGEEHTNIVNPEDIRMRIMSDSICVFVESKLFNSLPGLILTCAYYQADMLSLSPPILLRGGIARGTLYCEGDIIFGQGLTDAYLLESKNAKTPRVILTKNLFDSFENCDKHIKGLASRFLSNEVDAFYSLNYFLTFCELTAHKHEDGTSKVYTHIQDVLSKETDQSIREKYLYLASRLQPYYDRMK